MGLSCGENVLRLIFFLFNLFLWLSGVGLIIGGAVSLSNADDFAVNPESSLSHARGIFIGVIVVGCFVFLLGFLGCAGSLLKIRFMLAGFAVLVFLLLVIEIALGIAAIASKDKVETDIERIFNKSIESYSDSEAIRNFWDKYQREKKCCGTYGPQSWNESGDKPGRNSCCKEDDNCSYSQDKYLYERGCNEFAKADAKKMMIAVGVFCILFGMLQTLGLMAAFCLCRAIDD